MNKQTYDEITATLQNGLATLANETDPQRRAALAALMSELNEARNRAAT